MKTFIRNTETLWQDHLFYQPPSCRNSQFHEGTKAFYLGGWSLVAHIGNFVLEAIRKLLAGGRAATLSLDGASISTGATESLQNGLPQSLSLPLLSLKQSFSNLGTPDSWGFREGCWEFLAANPLNPGPKILCTKSHTFMYVVNIN